MGSALKVVNRLGMEMSVAIEGDTDPLDVARYWAKRGWRSVKVPLRGFKMPLIMAETFDWDLLGARPDVIDNASGVWFDGLFYKRRDLPANEKKKMEACVKYSRGFRSSIDDPEMAEGDDDGVQYVTLILFRGGGVPIRDYERRSKKPASRAESTPIDLNAEIARIVAQKKITDKQLHGLVLGVTGKRERDYRSASVTDMERQRIIVSLNEYKGHAA